MPKKEKNIIHNSKLHDSGGKLILGNDILCSQFLRDYGDVEILRKIQPEDIEDVSERYVPLYSTERESDTVKKINISKYLDDSRIENPLNLPLYIVSLVEHKTKVEYNVIMQILRYMIHIWEDFEREMNERIPGVSTRKDFRYPPILPIVYFEGKGNWTAVQDIADRIFCGELLGKYLPHFRYQLVRLHDYSNEALLAREDEISLAMLINKIQSPEDLTSFDNLSDQDLDKILDGTPEHLLDVLAKLLRALLYSMELPENATEDVVGRIKERKMGRLFENQTINFPAMQREAEELRQEAGRLQEEIKIGRREVLKLQQEAEKSKEEAEKSKEEAEKSKEEAEKSKEEAEKSKEEAEKSKEEAEQSKQEATRIRAICKRINKLIQDGVEPGMVKETVIREYSLTEEEAADIFESF